MCAVGAGGSITGGCDGAVVGVPLGGLTLPPSLLGGWLWYSVGGGGVGL